MFNQGAVASALRLQQQPLGAENGCHLLDRLLEMLIDHQIVEFVEMTHFLTRGRQAPGDDFFLACGGTVDPNAPLETHRDEERDVTFVTAEALHGWMEAGHADEVVIVDNRNLFTFEQQRIAGARLIPTDDVKSSLGSLPLNKWAVFYCT